MSSIKTETVSINTNGKPFDDGPHKGIRTICVEKGEQIDGIQITYVDGEGEFHGGYYGGQGVQQAEVLDDGEDIIKILAVVIPEGNRGLEYLQFETSYGRSLEFDVGVTKMSNSKTFIPPPGYVLGGLHGKADRFVDNLGFYWVKKAQDEEKNRLVNGPENDSRPWNRCLLYVASLFFLTAFIFPGWSRYQYTLEQDELGVMRICEVAIGPWGHQTSGDDDCSLGYKKHSPTFYCDLGIDDFNKELAGIEDCTADSTGGLMVLIGINMTVLCVAVALVAHHFAWKNHSWKEDPTLIHFSVAFTFQAALCGAVSWLGWNSVSSTIDKVLEEMGDNKSYAYVNFYLNFAGIGLLIVSAVLNILEVVNLNDLFDYDANTVATAISDDISTPLLDGSV